MATSSPLSLRRGALGALILLAFASSCVDAPSAPESSADIGAMRYIIGPSFALVSPTGPVATPAQASALADAFDRVDHFRLRITRQSTGELVLDVVIAVTPGQDSYDLSAEVESSDPSEIFLVTLTALEGEVELFKAEGIPVTATPVNQTGGNGGTPPSAVSIPLTYSGPGVSATSVEVGPDAVVLATGGTSQFGAKVLNVDGTVLPDVSVAWSTGSPSVATVSATGVVTATGGGITTVTATSPTGLTASGRVYVIDGTLAYVENGDVKVRAAAGGDAEVKSSGGGASAPTWGPGGLYFAQNGQVVSESDGPLFGGGWPSVSPDGSKIAADGGGAIQFANIDGSNPTGGPSGATPVWTGERTLIVSGGSIEQVDADGSNRTLIVPGEVGFPALGPGGQLAYVDNGSLRLLGGAILATGVGGRPSWSGDGAWIAFPGSEGLMVVPADGSAPPAALPGLGGASDPAWGGGGGGGGSGTAPTLTGFDPSPPVPGQEVHLLGTGFDDIIQRNNKVFWPGPDGSVESKITGVTPTSLTTVMPNRVVAGSVRVETFSGQATLDFVPTFGSLEVHAATVDGAAIAGVGVVVTASDGTEVARGETDGMGGFVAPGLIPGDYTLSFTAPSGYNVLGSNPLGVTVDAETAQVDVALDPRVDHVEVDPAVVSVAVGESTGATLRAFDVRGNEITTLRSVSWHGARDGAAASGSTATGLISGVYPSAPGAPAHYLVEVNGTFFTFPAMVTSYIDGTITSAPMVGTPGLMAAPMAAPAVPNVEVLLQNGGGTTLARTQSDGAGRYRFDGLFAGTYTVKPMPDGDEHASPAQASVTIGSDNATGRADFTVSGGPGGGGVRPPGVVAIYKDYNAWGSNKEENVLQSFGLVPGTDYVVRPTSDLTTGIPSGTSLIILTSLSGSGSPLANVNSPAAQANLAAFVSGGGWLLAHMADNVRTSYFGASGYLIPGMSGVPAESDYNCLGLVPVATDHPFIRGPDGVLGTGDDMNAANVVRVGACEDNHGALAGILPPGAEVLMNEAPAGGGRPVYATYGFGGGTVVVSTMTLEWPGNNNHIITNHLWWTVMGGAPPPSAPIVAPAAPSRAPIAGSPATSRVLVGGLSPVGTSFFR